MSLSQEQMKFAHHAAMLINYIFLQGYSCTFGETYRTTEQAAIYAKEGKGIIDSLHCKKLAIDLNLFKDSQFITDPKEYEQFGVWWEKLDPLNRWGGHFKRVDANHFERNSKM